ncbi:MAG: YwbE family protein [Solidesulfovibrio sp. DCME]|uniref:YwbE family protein n=1 Tax=Solidesulfovibrio sp. DCME TaxID=3447380 RepID=UPI003D0D61C8
MADGTVRAAIRPGLRVAIVLKKDQRSGALTFGVVKDILTKAPHHSRGIKVRLADGQIGRVKEIVASD